ncbi:unnamed protein product [Rangifer tarandus platyrhynchus]|uniref:Uncharacterized protein n=2 Tax=Rangifer tarandus platyrhynchus TaxID=3082113 RepID=A0ABN8Y989_RANTA|nr:unnamed protein product [Rangifer tarandus platyrhynchus]CAI9696151.1 unnamed protein product [Rangifer tarandus platyrhynchus]
MNGWVAVSRDNRCRADARPAVALLVEGAGPGGRDAPLRPPGSRLAVNALQGREDNEMDSHKPVGGDPGARRGCRWGGFDFYCCGIGAPPRVKTSVKDLPLPSPVVSTSRVTDSLPHSGTSGRVGGGTVRVPQALALSGQGGCGTPIRDGG